MHVPCGHFHLKSSRTFRPVLNWLDRTHELRLDIYKYHRKHNMNIFRKILSITFLIFSFSALTAHAALIQNGGFEDGEFTAWTRSGSSDHTDVRPGYGHAGSYGAVLGAQKEDGFLSQTFTTLKGGKYELIFWLFSDGKIENHFSTTVDGHSFFDQMNIPAQAYTRYVFDFIASSSATTLRFGFFNTPGFLRLDDVSIVSLQAIPEPGTTALLFLGLIGLAFNHRQTISRTQLQ
jgi:hypothetical protein